MSRITHIDIPKFLISNHRKGGRASYCARRFLATVLPESKSRAWWYLLRCRMQLICADENKYKLLCITLNVYEAGKLFSWHTDLELSRGESNSKLAELSVINGCYILPIPPYIARNPKFHRVAHEQVAIMRKHRT